MENKNVVLPNENLKYKHLIFGIVFDVIGMLSFTIPYVGEFGDVIWAPLSGIIIAKMYPNKVGKVAGVFSFLEELIPFTDVIPTFTFTWIYVYLIKKKV